MDGRPRPRAPEAEPPRARPVNANLRKEIQLTFSRQSQRRLVEQLVERQRGARPAAAPARGGGGSDDVPCVRRARARAGGRADRPGARPRSLDALPEQWPAELAGTPAQRAQYAELRARVARMARSVTALREKRRHYQHVVALVDPVDPAALAGAVVDPAAPIVRELAATRALAKEVADKLGRKRPAGALQRRKAAGKAASGAPAGMSAAQLVLDYFRQRRDP